MRLRIAIPTSTEVSSASVSPNGDHLSQSPLHFGRKSIFWRDVAKSYEMHCVYVRVIRLCPRCEGYVDCSFGVPVCRVRQKWLIDDVIELVSNAPYNNHLMRHKIRAKILTRRRCRCRQSTVDTHSKHHRMGFTLNRPAANMRAWSCGHWTHSTQHRISS